MSLTNVFLMIVLLVLIALNGVYFYTIYKKALFNNKDSIRRIEIASSYLKLAKEDLKSQNSLRKRINELQDELILQIEENIELQKLNERNNKK